jgi:uncharacterized damage-inducible protein DinB
VTLIDHFKSLLVYETWANKATLDSIESVPPSARQALTFERALQVMAHNQLARRAWLNRIHGKPHGVADWFPTWNVEQIAADAADLDRAWADFLGTLQDADLGRRIDYAASDGTAYSSLIRDILTHVANHSTYHRGQVARLVSEAGGRRATTDFIAMSRKAR